MSKTSFFEQAFIVKNEKQNMFKFSFCTHGFSIKPLYITTDVWFLYKGTSSNAQYILQP